MNKQCEEYLLHNHKLADKIDEGHICRHKQCIYTVIGVMACVCYKGLDNCLDAECICTLGPIFYLAWNAWGQQYQIFCKTT